MPTKNIMDENSQNQQQPPATKHNYKQKLDQQRDNI
jgi:hypothetical protein